MNVKLEILRFNPQTDDAAYTKSYDVSVDSEDRVLDALVKIKREQDGSLAFRKSCAHGVCGSDAMRINGKERLACKTLIKDVAESDDAVIVIEPLRHMKIQRDLMMDQDAFFAKFRSVKPYLVPASEPETGEFIQSQEDRELIDDATKCILCGACMSACPVLDENPAFLGPASIVQAARFVFDTRDKGLEQRLEVLDHPDGVWSCENHFECTRACPRGIKITKLINLTKRHIKKHREERGETTAETEKV